MKKTNENTIKFMDFCSGIGAGRLGLTNCGMECVGFSEINKPAETTYRQFFGQDEINYGDLMKINPTDLPDFDLMIAGFPCQTFSVIGQRKGFEDNRGQVIYGLINIMKAKNVKYFILENVKGLMNHDNGNTVRVILQALDDAGYQTSHKVLNSVDYGVPQSRERVYFVGIRKDLAKQVYKFPNPTESKNVSDYLIDDVELSAYEKETTYNTFIKYLNNKYNTGKHTIESLLSHEFDVIDTRQSDLRIYKNKIPTLRTGRHGIIYVRGGKFRKLTGYESLLLQGFPKELALKAKGKISETYILAQTGNAMTVSTIEAVAKELIKII